MYKISETTDIEDMTVERPLGPGLSPNVIEENDIVKMQTWGTTAKDPGPDYTEFRFFNSVGLMVRMIRVEGY